MARFSQCTAVVIGGTHGMGRAVAEALAGGGATVLVTGRDPGHVAAAQAEMATRITVMRSDVTDPADIATLTETVASDLGLLDAVFVFAGVAEFAPFAEVAPASFDRQFAVNARGGFFTVQALLPRIRDGGAITLTTVTPSTASPGMAVYLASKAAVRAFARTLAAELLDRQVRVNTLAPGFVATPTLGVAELTADERAELHAVGDAATPMRRHGTVDEVARAALFLAFDATFTTGIDLPVDGGISTVDAPQ